MKAFQLHLSASDVELGVQPDIFWCSGILLVAPSIYLYLGTVTVCLRLVGETAGQAGYSLCRLGCCLPQ
eukprot:scaffold9046_cov127-Isochrysis_galbana.AAC.1